MTALAPLRFSCRHCDASFANSATLGGHVHAQHPEQKRALPKFLTTSAPPRRPRGLKRHTDTWPGKP
jgi:hypothetical protein